MSWTVILKRIQIQVIQMLSCLPSGVWLPLPQTSLRAPISSTVSPLLPPPQRSRGQRRRRMLRRGPGGWEGPGEHPPALRHALQKQVLPLCHQWKRRRWRRWEKLRGLHAHTHAKTYLEKLWWRLNRPHTQTLYSLSKYSCVLVW